MIRNGSDIGVLGAGIMGCCLALELSRRGYRVYLIDLADRPMRGTSLHNEGKLHLGFVYANDPTGETFRLMVRGSMSFAAILERLTGTGPDSLGISEPFHYFLPVDSQLDMAGIGSHFEKVEQEIIRIRNESGCLYLGHDPGRYFVRNSADDHARLFAPEKTLGSFRTLERSVSTVAVADCLIRAIDRDAGVTFIGGTEVLSASQTASGEVRLETRGGGRHAVMSYPCVANCLWDDRLRVDRTAGIEDHGPWLMRYKAAITVTLQSPVAVSIPSATGILGPYGDVVNFNDNCFYISWYPLCKLAQGSDGDGRRLRGSVHRKPLSGFVERLKSLNPSVARSLASFTHRKFVGRNIREMSQYIPVLAGLQQLRKKFSVGGGVIIARGETDIDDPGSYLHRRSKIGPTAYGSYLTVDTGKYCTAPLFAVETADMIDDLTPVTTSHW